MINQSRLIDDVHTISQKQLDQAKDNDQHQLISTDKPAQSLNGCKVVGKMTKILTNHITTPLPNMLASAALIESGPVGPLIAPVAYVAADHVLDHFGVYTGLAAEKICNAITKHDCPDDVTPALDITTNAIIDNIDSVLQTGTTSLKNNDIESRQRAYDRAHLPTKNTSTLAIQQQLQYARRDSVITNALTSSPPSKDMFNVTHAVQQHLFNNNTDLSFFGHTTKNIDKIVTQLNEIDNSMVTKSNKSDNDFNTTFENHFFSNNNERSLYTGIGIFEPFSMSEKPTVTTFSEDGNQWNDHSNGYTTSDMQWNSGSDYSFDGFSTIY